MTPASELVLARLKPAADIGSLFDRLRGLFGQQPGLSSRAASLVRPGFFPVFVLSGGTSGPCYGVVIREKSAICKKVALMRASRLKRLRRTRSSSAMTMTFSKKASTGPRRLARALQTAG